MSCKISLNVIMEIVRERKEGSTKCEVVDTKTKDTTKKVYDCLTTVKTLDEEASNISKL